MKQKVQELQELASKVIGDSKRPELFFVSEEGVILTVTRNFDIAYKHWNDLSRKVETMLEARSYGVVCSTEPQEEGSDKLRTYDDAKQYRKAFPQLLYPQHVK